MNNDIENKREILEQRLETMWNFYDEIEMYVGDKESSDEVPDFSSFVQSAIKEPKDVFLEMIDTSNIHQNWKYHHKVYSMFFKRHKSSCCSWKGSD